MLQILPAAADAHGAALSSPSSSSSVAASASAPQTQPLPLDEWWTGVAARLARLQPNRQIFLDVAVPAAQKGVAAAAPSAPAAGSKKGAAAASTSKPQLAIPSPAPRYSLWILDADLSGTAAASSRSCRATVLVLPQGRESEWQFRSVSGGSEIARANGLARVIFVALNRGQEFKSLAAVQAELQPFLRLLSPSSLTEKMSITSLGSDVGQRRSVAREASSSVQGGFVEIEDVLVGQHVHRRMVFSGTAGGGSGLVQSEARLNVAPAFLSMTAAQRKALKAKQKKKAKKKTASAANAGASAGAGAAEEEGKDDDAAETAGDDDAEADAAASTSSSSATAATAASSSSNSLICFNYLPCEYQHGLLALLALFGASAPAAAAASSSAVAPASPAALPSSMLLVGLGGGSLAMFLALSLPRLQLDVVELDGKVLETARTYFGYKEPGTTAAAAERVRTHVMDGLAVVAQLASGVAQPASSPSASAAAAYSSPITRPDVILLDVNSPDLGEGLSFPPAAFLAPAFLDEVARVLAASPAAAASSDSAADAAAASIPARSEDGWLLLNLGCRNEPLRDSLFAALTSRFRSVFALKPDAAHVNNVVAATNRDLRGTAATTAASSSAAVVAPANPSLDWESTSQRLAALQSAAGSSFTWSAEMSEEVQSMLKRLQWVEASSSGTAAATVRMHAVFPKQQAEEEEKEKGDK